MSTTMSGLGDRVNLNSPATEPGPLTEADLYRPAAECCTDVGINETTKRFPRTLGDAFRGAEYATAFHRFERGLDWFNGKAPMLIVCVLGCGFALGLIAKFWRYA